MTTKYTVGFIFDQHCARVLLMTKARPSWQAGKLNGIGGHIEQDERPIDAMIREAVEEVGVRLPASTGPYGGWNQFCVLNAPHKVGGLPDWRVYFYRTFSDAAIGDAKAQTDEAVAIYYTADLPVNVLPNLNWLIPMAAWDRRNTYHVEEL